MKIVDHIIIAYYQYIQDSGKKPECIYMNTDDVEKMEEEMKDEVQIEGECTQVFGVDVIRSEYMEKGVFIMGKGFRLEIDYSELFKNDDLPF